MKQTILTFVTKVDPDRVSDLRILLKDMAADVELNVLIPFPKLKSLHFASLMLHEDRRYGAYLVFESNLDGSLDPYLEGLYAQAAAGLHTIYSCCRDYRAASAADKDQLLSYLRAHVVYPNAYHIGNTGRSVECIHQESVLRDRLEDFLDVLVWQGNPGQPGWVRQKIQSFVRGQPGFAWAASVQPRQTAMERFLPRLKLVAVAVIALVLLPLLTPLAIVWVVMLRWRESHDPPPRVDLDVKDHVQELVESEDRAHIVQNHMVSITIVKPGAFRRLTLRGVFWLVNLLKRTSARSDFSGVPSIHFAHWSLIDKGRRVLFVSNYDGSWENYLGDFIDKVSPGLNAIWSNTLDFPAVRFLIRDGAHDGPAFKAWGRAHQSDTNVWYSAYKQLTVETIDNNSAIREDLFTSLDDSATRAWVWRF